jgi:hypothetical protein
LACNVPHRNISECVQRCVRKFHPANLAARSLDVYGELDTKHDSARQPTESSVMSNWTKITGYEESVVTSRVTRKQFVVMIERRLRRAGDDREVKVDRRRFRMKAGNGPWVAAESYYQRFANADLKGDTWGRRRAQQDLQLELWSRDPMPRPREQGFFPNQLVYGPTWAGGAMS